MCDSDWFFWSNLGLLKNMGPIIGEHPCDHNNSKYAKVFKINYMEPNYKNTVELNIIAEEKLIVINISASWKFLPTLK